ncbi:ribosome silencing factor [Leucobacter sp. OH2974_COT-288]|uniref:Ribosomal silencing factor RsfS n=1 Tax=Canibacter oris TaxID=1365628 RepID=A0A840DGH2_9MICO|nr:ribosome silencing factor [Canibacter oris]MBB4070803.1 ribosome-associated protein [Canibacter oris]RRD36184.1 ribosome silencing factor [Leucobacter sp. OH2974_COT-288]
MVEKLTAAQQLEIALQAGQKVDALDPVALEVSEVFGYADVFLIVGGTVERNVQAIAREIEDALNLSGVKTLRREGRETGRWILLDFGDLIVHVFHQEEREFYSLERLWDDGRKIDVSQYLAG